MVLNQHTFDTLCDAQHIMHNLSTVGGCFMQRTTAWYNVVARCASINHTAQLRTYFAMYVYSLHFLIEALSTYKARYVISAVPHIVTPCSRVHTPHYTTSNAHAPNHDQPLNIWCLYDAMFCILCTISCQVVIASYDAQSLDTTSYCVLCIN